MSEEIEARWALVLPHREHLLAVARRRCGSLEDAEDCVQEAMLRVVHFDGLDPERIEAMLTSVTTRLAVDMHRARERARRYQPRLVHVPAQQQPPDEAALDAGEARWLASRIEDLPEREREVFRQRAAGYSAGEAAARLSLSYKAVESAFTRARGRMRAWAGVAVLLGAEYLRRLRQRPATVYASAVMVSAGCIVLSSLPQTPAPGSKHGARVPGIATAHAPVQRVGAVAAALPGSAGVQLRMSSAAATASGGTASGSGAAAPKSPANPQIAGTSFGGPGGTVTIHVVAWAPPGNSATSRALLCVEEGELVHTDGTVGCPRQ